jgi:hypothetical protein
VDKSDIETDTGKTEIPADFSKLPGYRKAAEKLSLCQAEDA